jgi:uncharacterized protein YjbI with pentapeptide repeats
MVVVISLFLSAGVVQATTIDLRGVNFPDTIFATADFTYAPLSTTTGEIDVIMTNTSTVTSALTAFAFNTPANLTGVSSFTGPTGWTYEFTPDGINTPGQFGFFDLASITGPNFNGGKPLNGIWDGDSGSFVFNVIGTDMLALNTDGFFSLFSDLGGKTGTPENFIARFQAIGLNGGSDVAIPTNGVPEPATVLLLGVGIVGLAFGERRRRK